MASVLRRRASARRSRSIGSAVRVYNIASRRWLSRFSGCPGDVAARRRICAVFCCFLRRRDFRQRPAAAEGVSGPPLTKASPRKRPVTGCAGMCFILWLCPLISFLKTVRGQLPESASDYTVARACDYNVVSCRTGSLINSSLPLPLRRSVCLHRAMCLQFVDF